MNDYVKKGFDSKIQKEMIMIIYNQLGQKLEDTVGLFRNIIPAVADA